MNYYIEMFKRWSDFNGRSRRAEYWYPFLINFIIGLVFQIVMKELVSVTVFFVYIAYVVILIIPTLALTIRRLHDIGKSGWMVFINLIPIIGAIWFIVLLAREGDLGDNKYGPNPKGSVLPAQPITPQV